MSMSAANVMKLEQPSVGQDSIKKLVAISDALKDTLEYCDRQDGVMALIKSENIERLNAEIKKEDSDDTLIGLYRKRIEECDMSADAYASIRTMLRTVADSAVRAIRASGRMNDV